MNPYILIIIAAILFIMWNGHKKILELNAQNMEFKLEIARLVVVNEQNVAKLNQFKTDLEASIVELNRVTEDYQRIERIRREQETALRSAIGRQDVVWERPTLVERYLQRNWKDFTDKISCDTGADERCEK